MRPDYPGRQRGLIATTLLVVGVTSACVHRDPVPGAATSRPVEFITAEEIERSGAKTAWDAIRLTIRGVSLRQASNGTPRRIEHRGKSSILFNDQTGIILDRVRISDVRILIQIPASDLESIELLSGLDATTCYGTNAGDGVLILRTKGATAR
ncbi:MAG: TonB-dependent receptor [Gemmatimonadaceae bacterium]